MPINKLKPKYKAVKKSRGRRIRKTKRRTRKRSKSRPRKTKRRSRRRSRSMLFSMRGGGICPVCRGGAGLDKPQPWAPDKEGAIATGEELVDAEGPRFIGECPVCFTDDLNAMVMLPCKHILCRNCAGRVGFRPEGQDLQSGAPLSAGENAARQQRRLLDSFHETGIL